MASVFRVLVGPIACAFAVVSIAAQSSGPVKRFEAASLKPNGWYGVDRFDLVATAPGASRVDVALMLQTLLAERFKLLLHRETREVPFTALREQLKLGSTSALPASSSTPVPSAPRQARGW